MNDDSLKEEAGKTAIHSLGTSVIFRKRYDKLANIIRLRDFSGFAVPVIVAFLFTGELSDGLKEYRHGLIVALGIAATIQALVVLWSILSRWDEKLSYSNAASSDSYTISNKWKELSLGNIKYVAYEYARLKADQERLDADHIKQSISAAEMRNGLRSSLIVFQRKCVCGHIPKTSKPPMFPKLPCDTCGGNKGE